MQIICCACQKTKSPSGWTKLTTRAGSQISHGYCPQCYKQMLKRIDNFSILNGYSKSA